MDENEAKICDATLKILTKIMKLRTLLRDQDCNCQAIRKEIYDWQQVLNVLQGSEKFDFTK